VLYIKKMILKKRSSYDSHVKSYIGRDHKKSG